MSGETLTGKLCKRSVALESEISQLKEELSVQAELIERYEKALKKISEQSIVGEGHPNADMIANDLIHIANKALNK